MSREAREVTGRGVHGKGDMDGEYIDQWAARRLPEHRKNREVSGE